MLNRKGLTEMMLLSTHNIYVLVEKYEKLFSITHLIWRPKIPNFTVAEV